MYVDYNNNKEYYNDYVPCACELCEHYYRHIKNCYPKIDAYLQSMGVDILKPFELTPYELGELHEIYYQCQYIIFGECEDEFEAEIDGIKFFKNIDSHPSDNHITKEHFVLEFGMITLELETDICDLKEGRTMKKRKIIALCIFLLAVIAGIIWYKMPVHFTGMNSDEVVEIVIFDGSSGKTLHITERMEIETIIDNLNSVKMRRDGIIL